MKNFNVSEKNILIYRIIFTVLSWFTFITGFFINSISSGLPFIWLNSFIYYTMQTNFMVTIWFTLAIIWYKKPQLLEKITGALKGAFTLYITITFVIFAVLLQMFYPFPKGWAAFSNLVLHYITPIAFIFDWILTENKIKYKWTYMLYWIVYPVCYIIFAVIHGTITDNYIYYFFDINALGILGFVMYTSILIVFGIVLAGLYTAINRRRTKY